MAKPVVSSKIGTESKLIAYACNVVQKIRENASLFPNATSKIAELDTTLKAYLDARTEAGFGDIRKIVIKNQQKDLVRQNLLLLALDVAAVAKGDPNLLLAAGYIPSKGNGTRIGQAPKANDLRAAVVYPGTNTVQLRVQRWLPTKFYRFEYRKTDSTDEWTAVFSTKSRIAVANLEYLQEYEFRVTYLSTVPIPNYSDTVRCVVV